MCYMRACEKLPGLSRVAAEKGSQPLAKKATLQPSREAPSTYANSQRTLRPGKGGLERRRGSSIVPYNLKVPSGKTTRDRVPSDPAGRRHKASSTSKESHVSDMAAGKAIGTRTQSKTNLVDRLEAKLQDFALYHNAVA